jgi:GNAT superfamily N-acetyltransferase
VLLSPGTPLVRVATAADVPGLAALRARWTREEDGEVDDPDFERRFRAWYETEAARRVSWLAEVGGHPVGMVNLAVFERMPAPGRPARRWGYLSNAFVLGAFRDQGVGSLLLDALLAHADAAGLVRVVLSPSSRSMPFYRRAGFGPADMLMARPAQGT